MPDHLLDFVRTHRESDGHEVAMCSEDPLDLVAG
jgi:hypothetical protein